MYPNYLDHITTSAEMENSMFTLQLDRLFSIWNNAIYHRNLWVHTVGTYRATALLGRVQKAFFDYYYFSKMTNIPDEIVLVKDNDSIRLEFERALHYHDEGCDSDNDYDVPGPSMRPVCIHLVSLTEASLNPTDYKETQGSTSPSTPR